MGIDWRASVPWILSAFTILIGIWQYAEKSAQANREPFLREQLKLAIETSEVVGRLATSVDAVQWESDRSRFWALYYGPLAIVEDIDVEREMVSVGKMVPRPGQAVPELPFNKLQGTALGLDYRLRQLILKAWGMDLSHLQLREVTR